MLFVSCLMLFPSSSSHGKAKSFWARQCLWNKHRNVIWFLHKRPRSNKVNIWWADGWCHVDCQALIWSAKNESERMWSNESSVFCSKLLSRNNSLIAPLKLHLFSSSSRKTCRNNFSQEFPQMRTKTEFLDHRLEQRFHKLSKTIRGINVNDRDLFWDYGNMQCENLSSWMTQAEVYLEIFYCSAKFLSICGCER